MQTWRSGSTKKKPGKATPKEFSRKPGRKPRPAGSLLPAPTAAEIKTAKLAKETKEKPEIKPITPATGSQDNDEPSDSMPAGFTGEETSWLLGDITQIADPDHMLRLDFMIPLVDILNEMSVKLDWSAVIFPPQYPSMAKVLQSKHVDWSFRWDEYPRCFDGSPAFESDSFMNRYVDLFKRHQNVQSIFFFDHSTGDEKDKAGHWTLFLHHVVEGKVICYDSGVQHKRKDISSQLLLASFFRPDRPKVPVSLIKATRSTRPEAETLCRLLYRRRGVGCIPHSQLAISRTHIHVVITPLPTSFGALLALNSPRKWITSHLV